jgi:hypothetical protein
VSPLNTPALQQGLFTVDEEKHLPALCVLWKLFRVVLQPWLFLAQPQGVLAFKYEGLNWTQYSQGYLLRFWSFLLAVPLLYYSITQIPDISLSKSLSISF